MATRANAPHLWLNPKSGRFYLVWQEGGFPRRQSLRTKDKAEAERIMGQVVQDLSGSGAASVQNLTLEEAAIQWLEDRASPERGLSRTTICAYTTFAKQLLAVANPDQFVAAMTPRDCRLILRGISSQFGHGTGTAKKRHVQLSTFFAWLARDEVISRNPVDSLEVPRADHQRRPELSEAEYGNLCADITRAIQGADTATRARGLQALLDQVQVLWLSGMRSVESRRLDWVDIDLEAMVWTIRSPQNKGGIQTLPIHQDLGDLLKRRRLLGGPGPFQPPARMQYWWRRFKAEHPAWQGTSLHSLRASFVTRLRRTGAAEAARDLARHKSQSMSDRYNHTALEEHRSALDSI